MQIYRVLFLVQNGVYSPWLFSPMFVILVSILIGNPPQQQQPGKKIYVSIFRFLPVTNSVCQISFKRMSTDFVTANEN